MFSATMLAFEKLTTTANGAVSHSTTGNACVDMFAGSVRGSNYTLTKLAKAAYEESPLDVLKLIAYIRDSRGGKGERELGRTLLVWLSEKNPEALKKNLKHYIEFGRWDDIFVLFGGPLEDFAIDLLI